MYRVIALCVLGWSLQLSAAVLVSPQQALQQTFGTECTVAKKSLLLTKKQAKQVSQQVKRKLSSRLYRTFTVQKAEEVVGYGVLLNGPVRTKNAAVLYMITPNGVMEAVEMIAFNEPPEYQPGSQWMGQFHGKTSEDALLVGKDIPTITGATMSARNVADGARLALALYDIGIKP